MRTLVIRPITRTEVPLYLRRMRAKDSERFLRVPPKLGLERAARNGMAVGGFFVPGNEMVCGAVVYDREFDCQLYCREFGSVFSHLKRYGLMRVIGRPLIVQHALITRTDIPLIGIARRNNSKSIGSLKNLYFDSARPELVARLDAARHLNPETGMWVFNDAHLVEIIDELLETYPDGIVTRSVKPMRRLRVRFELPLLPEATLRHFRTSLVGSTEKVIQFPRIIGVKR